MMTDINNLPYNLHQARGSIDDSAHVTHRRHTFRPLVHDTYVQIPALGRWTSRRSCPGSGQLRILSLFVRIGPYLAVGPKIHIFCPDQEQGFPAIVGGPDWVVKATSEHLTRYTFM
ncbi:hypothetical protein K443DRAFT_168729 [Laccaria amethystina LaAM-08-1]|uniref:Uncharacterized protein n=1 Tax=Laccaria amethystina LaAM-08-1 TaxID=1095629 RepID=A0A0C9YBK9_9AGAR|nr:hypothetical protein K443DRAFT_168729 [Laccaria amethystina LaAM-08-1]